MKKSAVLLSFFILLFTFQSCQEELFLSDLDNDLSEQDQETDFTDHRNCNLQQHMNQLLSDPDYERKHRNKFIAMQNALRSIQERDNCNSPEIIPVAVHFQNISNPDKPCLINLAKKQVQILNQDFHGNNTDISKWNNSASIQFPEIQYAETCIQFILANKNHPSGYGLNNGSVAVTFNKTSGDYESDWAGYLNIFVQSGTGVLGYAPLGGLGNGDGVVIDANAFGAGPGCGNIEPLDPFDLGRTTTHEVGHYLLLDHIWGDGCNIDDGVTDTPDAREEYYDCPSLNQSSCGSNDLHMNYMDYTNDACMYMFTKGQENRMEAYIKSSLKNLTNNASNVIEGQEDSDDSDDDNGDGEDTEGDESDEDDQVESDCSAEAIDAFSGEPLENNTCYQEVIANDSYCCDVEFDYLCQEAYDECVDYQEEDEDEGNEDTDDEEDEDTDTQNCTVNPIDFTTGQNLSNTNCIELIQEMDSYCCEVEWDRLCQFYYDGCNTEGLIINEYASENAVVLLAQNNSTGEVQISYSVKEWSPNLTIQIEHKGQTILKEKILNRRGSIVRVIDEKFRNNQLSVSLNRDQKTLKTSFLKS